MRKNPVRRLRAFVKKNPVRRIRAFVKKNPERRFRRLWNAARMFIQFIGGAQFRNYLVEIFQETWWRSSGRLNEDLFGDLYFSQKHFFDSRVTHKQRYVKDSFLQRTSRYVSVGGGNVTNLCSACQSCWTKSLLMLSMSELSNKKLAYAQPVRVVEQKAWFKRDGTIYQIVRERDFRIISHKKTISFKIYIKDICLWIV